MHSNCYDLGRFTPDPMEDLDDAGSNIAYSKKDRAKHFALEEAEQQQFIAITKWLEALCDHETGIELLFAPAHIYGSTHLIEEQPRHERWLVLFYEASQIAGEVGPHNEANFGLRQHLSYDYAGDIILHIVQLTTREPLTAELEEQMYQRVVAAANAHASGNTAIMSLQQALELTNSSTH